MKPRPLGTALHRRIDLRQAQLLCFVATQSTWDPKNHRRTISMVVGPFNPTQITKKNGFHQQNSSKKFDFAQFLLGICQDLMLTREKLDLTNRNGDVCQNELTKMCRLNLRSFPWSHQKWGY